MVAATAWGMSEGSGKNGSCYLTSATGMSEGSGKNGSCYLARGMSEGRGREEFITNHTNGDELVVSGLGEGKMVAATL